MGGGRGGGEETIYVAVGKKLDRNTTTLSWALRNFQGKKICLLHVQKPSDSSELNVTRSTLKNGFTVLQKDNEMEKVQKVLNNCLDFLAQEGVEAFKACIEMDDVGKGIIEGILCYNIKWLVMGGAASKHYSNKLSRLKSRKAMFVCQNAPEFSQIWFTCKGCLIYTRDARNYKPGTETASPLCSQTSGTGLELVEYSGKELAPIAYYKQKSLDFVRNSSHVFEQRSRSGDFSSDLRNRNESEEMLRCLPPESSENLAITWKTTSETDEEDRYEDAAVHDIYCKLEEVRLNGKNFRREQFGEAVKRWKAEDDAMDVKKKAMELETSCAKVVTERKELEQALASKRQDLQTIKNQRQEKLTELKYVQEQNSVLENRISESRLAVAELEEKILSAVDLLISFKAQRDEVRVEHGNALKEVSKLRRSVKLDAPTLCSPQIHLFSFEEIVEATNSFDPSLRVDEGKYGTVYRGTLRYMQVTIKMLPSFGSSRDSDFEHEVELSIRVRHPNLVTLIGTCPESRALIYEYLKNGNLEDRLSCKSKTRPLSWQTRTLVACDVCSALIFLHSHNPPIVHGNIKPSNILLDANFVAKISDLGIFHNLKPSETTSDVYSFGIMLLQLISGRADRNIVKDLKCSFEKGNFESILDDSAGEWPLDLAVQLVQLALRCCEEDRFTDLVSDVWSVLEPMRAVSIDSASNARFKEGRSAPSHFVCPIFQEVMKEPHIAADGFTYEAEAIQGWLKSHNTSPMTNLKLETTDLVPNHALLNAIQEWRQLV